MRKVLLEVPGLGWAVPSFGVAMLLACLAALGWTYRRARRDGIDPDAVSGLSLWLMWGGFLGARAWYVASHPGALQSLADVVRVWQGGVVYYGCIVGGLTGSIIYWYRRPFPFRKMADAVAPALALGLAVGRVGCLLNGCCYGAVCDGPWSTTFPPGSLPWNRQVHDGLIAISAPSSLPVFPTQLFSVVDGLVILGVLTAYLPLRRRPGEVMGLLMLTYPLTRFVIEALRDDDPKPVFGLSLSQAMSLLIFVAGLVVWRVLPSEPEPSGACAGLRGPRALRGIRGGSAQISP